MTQKSRRVVSWYENVWM